MDNRQFDAWMRQQALREPFSLTPRAERRMQMARQRPMSKARSSFSFRLTPRLALSLALLLALLCGVAVAAIQWGTRSWIAFPDEEGEMVVNEEVAALIQPIKAVPVTGAPQDAAPQDAAAAPPVPTQPGEVIPSQNGLLDLRFLDGIYDGKSLLLTWTMTSRHDRQIYLFLTTQEAGGLEPSAGGSMRNADEVFLDPGQSLESAMTRQMDGYGGESITVRLRYEVMAMKGVPTPFRFDGEFSDPDAERRAHQQAIDAYYDQGKIPIAGDGSIEYPSSVVEALWDAGADGKSRSQIYREAGILEQLDEVEVEFTLMDNAKTQQLAPAGEGQAFDMGDYTLRITSLELLPNSIHLRVERVFADTAALQKYEAYYTSKHTPLWFYQVQDGAGRDDWFDGGGGVVNQAPEAQADGSWVWPYEISVTGIHRMPDSIQLVCLRDPIGGDPTKPEVIEAESVMLPLQ